MNRLVKNAASRLGDYIFTRRCAFCGEVTEIDMRLCPDCEAPPINSPPYCEFCGVSKELCTCKKHRREFKSFCAPYLYVGGAKRAVRNFKSSEMPFLAKRFGSDIARAVNENFADVHFDYVACVPMRRRELNKRGYNQSELLAKRVADIIGVPFADLLVKTENTSPQKSCSERERRVNVYGVFDVKDKPLVNGKTILIVDDVKTTGATLSECAKILNIYDAKSVYCAAFAATYTKKR